MPLTATHLFRKSTAILPFHSAWPHWMNSFWKRSSYASVSMSLTLFFTSVPSFPLNMIVTAELLICNRMTGFLSVPLLSKKSPYFKIISILCKTEKASSTTDALSI